jgi:O-acetyl-ADP-ribose deacetylase (regulator of RNase III)
MSEINYIQGDATQPIGKGNKIIVHICNNIGGWGRGFVMAISNRWKEPEKQYRNWFKTKDEFELGNVQFVEVESELIIANLIGQHKIRKDEEGNPPIRYDAVRRGLNKVARKAKEINAEVHMPRIGCGLAGGKWEEIEPIILEEISSLGIGVTVYDFG